MKCEEKIAILMATYNGEKFIAEQLESLFSQTDQRFSIFIRDDGSNDNTVGIIRTISDKYPNRIIIMEDSVIHRGARDGFLWLLENIDAEYYMFCDQDDVWLPFKVEHTRLRIEEIEKRNPHKGVMIHTDLKIVDSNLNEIYPSYWKWRKWIVDLNKHFNFAALENVFVGCTIMINNKVKDYIFPINKKMVMHDEWIGISVAKQGAVGNLKEQTILYRQHNSNVISAGEKKDFNYSRCSTFIFNDWYMSRKEILDSINYGPKYKAIVYKIIYTLTRVLFA